MTCSLPFKTYHKYKYIVLTQSLQNSILGADMLPVKPLPAMPTYIPWVQVLILAAVMAI